MNRIVNLQKLFLKYGEESAIEEGRSYVGILSESIELDHPVTLHTAEGKRRMNTSDVTKIVRTSIKHVLFETSTSIYLLTYL